MSKIEDGGPAFPVVVQLSDNHLVRREEGMTLRDYFAAKALQGMLANQHPYQASDEHMFARDAYTLADAMIRARKEGGAS